MAIKIGHASIDERGKASGGSAGDQTGKEVCVRTWYSKPWSLVLRPKSASVATIKVPSVKIPTVKVPEIKVSDSFWGKWFAEHPIVVSYKATTLG